MTLPRELASKPLEGNQYIAALQGVSDYSKKITNLNIINENLGVILEEYVAKEEQQKIFTEQHEEELMREQTLLEEREEKEKAETAEYLAAQQARERELLQKIIELNELDNKDRKNEIEEIEDKIAKIEAKISALKTSIEERGKTTQDADKVIENNDIKVAEFIGNLSLRDENGAALTVPAATLLTTQPASENTNTNANENTPQPVPHPAKVIDVVLSSHVASEEAQGKSLAAIKDDIKPQDFADHAVKMKALMSGISALGKTRTNPNREGSKNLATILNEGNNRGQIDGLIHTQLTATVGQVFGNNTPEGYKPDQKVADINVEKTAVIVSNVFNNIADKKELGQLESELTTQKKLLSEVKKDYVEESTSTYSPKPK